MRSSDGSTTDIGNVGGQPNNDDDAAARNRVLAARDRLRARDHGHMGVPAATPLSDRAKELECQQLEWERVDREEHIASLHRLERMRKREAELDVDPEPAEPATTDDILRDIGRHYAAQDPGLVHPDVTPGTLQSTLWVAFAFLFVLGLIMLVLLLRIIMLGAIR